jgi:hypothetical protein
MQLFLRSARRACSICIVCDFLIADNLPPTFGHIRTAEYAPQSWEADLAKGKPQKTFDGDLVDGRFAPVNEYECEYEFGAHRGFALISNDGR